MNRSIRQAWTDSNRPAVLLIVGVLVLVFAGMIAQRYAKPPSPLMSRDLTLIEIAPSGPGTGRDRVRAFSGPNGESFTVVVPDGSSTRVLGVDVLGTVTDELVLELDLSASRELEGFMPDRNRVMLISREEELLLVEIDLRTSTSRTSVIDESPLSFESDGSLVAIEREDGLYGLDLSRPDEMVVIHDGPVRDYAIDAHAEQLFLAVVGDAGVGTYNVRLGVLNDRLQAIRDAVVVESETSDRFHRVEAVHAEGGLASILFLNRDVRGNTNYYTVRRYRESTLDQVAEYRAETPINSNRYAFTGSDGESLTVLFRLSTEFGNNLLACTMSEGDPRFIPYTKTREHTMLGDFLVLGEWNAIVFADYGRDTTSIRYASDHPDVIRRSRRWSGQIVGRSLAAAVSVPVMALFVGAVFFFFASLVPFLVVYGLQRLWPAEGMRNYAYCGVGSVLFLAEKLFVTWFVIARTPNYRFFIPGLGAPPWIFVVLAVTSVLAYLLGARFLKPGSSQTPSGAFVRSAVVDSTFYALLFLLYVVATLLITKI